jgi:hypothetical protein
MIIAMASAGCVMSLASCGIFHSTKSAKQSFQRDSTNQVQVKTTTIDTGTVITREVNDFKFYSPEFKAGSKFLLTPQQLLKKLSFGLTAIDSGMLQVNLHYDSLKNTLTVNATKRPESGDHHQEKITSEKKGLTTTTQSQQKVQVKEKKSDEQKESKPSFTWLLYVVGIGIIGGAALGWYIKWQMNKPHEKDNTDGSQA